MLSSTRSFWLAKRMHKLPLFWMSSKALPKNYFMIRYNYDEDGYYRRLGEIKQHQKALESLKSRFNTKLISTHFFPYSGKLFVLETEATAEEVEQHVKADPYITNGKIVKDYEIKQFHISSIREFQNISSEFLERY
mmetsp:Transcript_11430/g.12978  ORF Transcript_11430/g.12978 Transcript_11430/m.12978 type:complete len:136 (-) Transcript_11430:100-507(-)